MRVVAFDTSHWFRSTCGASITFVAQGDCLESSVQRRMNKTSVVKIDDTHRETAACCEGEQLVVTSLLRRLHFCREA